MDLVRLHLLGYKGFYLLKNLPDRYLPMVEIVVVGCDPNVKNDYSIEIKNTCKEKNISCVDRKIEPEVTASYGILVGWRWMEEAKDTVSLIVFHDSLLPRYRGFNPLVTALINGDTFIGATCLYGSQEYDKGDIIEQRYIAIQYPITIASAIEKVADIYLALLKNVLDRIHNNNLFAIPQDESMATYSLWRNEEDYFIDWTWGAAKIERFINAVGDPYSGAKSYVGKDVVIFRTSMALAEDVIIENRQPGKVIFKKDGALVIVCGQGLLSISECYRQDGTTFPLENKFRMRFHKFSE